MVFLCPQAALKESVTGVEFPEVSTTPDTIVYDIPTRPSIFDAQTYGGMKLLLSLVACFTGDEFVQGMQ